MVDVLRDIETRLRKIRDVAVSASMFGDEDAYWVNGKEIAHFEGDSRIDVRLTRPVIRDRRPELKADDRVELRPNSSDWIMVRFSSRADVGFVVDLVTTAAAAHRPPPGQASRPPPEGEALRRRRRFH